MRNIFLILILSLTVACGKNGGSSKPQNDDNKNPDPSEDEVIDEVIFEGDYRAIIENKFVTLHFGEGVKVGDVVYDFMMSYENQDCKALRLIVSKDSDESYVLDIIDVFNINDEEPGACRDLEDKFILSDDQLIRIYQE